MKIEVDDRPITCECGHKECKLVCRYWVRQWRSQLEAYFEGGTWTYTNNAVLKPQKPPFS